MIKLGKLVFILFYLVMSTNAVSGQQHSKAYKYHNKALQYYQASAYDEALDEVKKAIKVDRDYIESWLLAGDIQSLKGQYTEAITSYEKAIEIDSTFFVPAYYILANLYFNQGQYSKSITCFSKYLAYPKIKDLEKAKASRKTEIARFRIVSMDHPVPFNPINLGNQINTAGYEFVNYISPDGQKLYFTRRMLEGNKRDEQFFISEKISDTAWSQSFDLGPPINTDGDEGALALSPDGQYLFFSACNTPDGFGSCDIYVSILKGNEWSEPVNLGSKVNTPGWESQPTFSSDGRTLYFVSNRVGGMGGSDIWVSFLDENGNWSTPLNAGSNINTSDAERGPFIHPDGVTLYFSSKGHVGMGEGDIFYSSLKDGVWTQPLNVGYPINTKEDEVTMIVDNEGKYAYFSSARQDGFGLQDIYSFELPDQARPLIVSYMKGVVYDSITKHPLQAVVRLLDPVTGDTVITSISNDEDGSFLLCIPSGKNYALNVERKGYLFYSAHFIMQEEKDFINPFVKNIPLKPLREGESLILRNIFFQTDSFNLLPTSTAELDQVYSLLLANNRMIIEISGHTDDVGANDYNQNLSEYRAFSVYKYLIEAGIDSRRLSYKGYGMVRPLAGNDTPEGRALNRRTEILILQLN